MINFTRDVCSVNTSRQSSRHNSGHSSHSSKKLKSYRNSEDVSMSQNQTMIDNLSSAWRPLSCHSSCGENFSVWNNSRHSRSSSRDIWTHPRQCRHRPGIPGDISDRSENNSQLKCYQAWLLGSHNRTTKSGILVENPISRVDFPTSPEAVAKNISETGDIEKSGGDSDNSDE